MSLLPDKQICQIFEFAEHHKTRLVWVQLAGELRTLYTEQAYKELCFEMSTGDWHAHTAEVVYIRTASLDWDEVVGGAA